MTDPALVIFDVDGTLVDSQAQIVAAFTAMYEAAGRAPRDRAELLSVVGLSLTVAISRLEPDLGAPDLEDWAEAYRGAFVAIRAGDLASPLYPGALTALEALAVAPGVALGIATGKSRRGLRHVFGSHDLSRFFVTTQTADEHPSKPHPSMIEAALAETGARPERAVIVGDTAFDIEMGRAAGIRTIGVAWGYHPAEHLAAAGADAIIADFGALDGAVREVSEVIR